MFSNPRRRAPDLLVHRTAQDVACPTICPGSSRSLGNHSHTIRQHVIGGGGVALDIPKSVFFGRKCERFFESCFSNQFRLPSTRTTRCTRSPPTPRLSNILRPLFLPSSPFVRRDARV
uniref:Uncharacterized protein n=1 Tax=Sipha flava TaxID=143950 RepID=A0A2S2R9B8_9HEMI